VDDETAACAGHLRCDNCLPWSDAEVGRCTRIPLCLVTGISFQGTNSSVFPLAKCKKICPWACTISRKN
jgi:hypothetical protein